MEYRTLGRSGLHVSRICLGTMTFGWQLNEADSLEIINEALDRGINFIDTADVYEDGASELIVGKALKGRRDKIVLASKCAGKMSDDINDIGLSRKVIINHVEGSLKRLDTDYLDVLYLHFPDNDTALEEIILTVNTLIEQGKIRYYGVSNFPAWQCCAIMHIAKELHVSQPIATENVYNIITRGLDDELLPFLKAYPMSLVTYNPLAAGLLTGKHLHGKIEKGSRFDLNAGYAARYVKASNNEAVEDIMAIAESEGVTSIYLAYQWLISKDYITSVLCGVSKVPQLTSNLAACEGVTVSPEALAKCDEIWKGLKGDYFNYHY